MTRVRNLSKLFSKQNNLDARIIRDSNFILSVAQTEARDSAHARSVIDSSYVQLKQSKNFASYTNKPTTLSGYGITDTRSLPQIRTASDSAFTNQFVAGAPSNLNNLDKIAAAMNDDSDVFNTLKSFAGRYGYDSATLGPYTQTEQLFEADGVFTVPENVFNIDIWAVGGGGGGQPGNAGRGSGAGGGGGAFVRLIGYHVTPGDKLNITVGQAGQQGWVIKPGYNSGSSGTPFGPQTTVTNYYSPSFAYGGNATASTVYDSSRGIQVLSAGGGNSGTNTYSTSPGVSYSGGSGGTATVDSDAKNHYSVSSLAIQNNGSTGDNGQSDIGGQEGGGGGAAGGIGGQGGHGLLRRVNHPSYTMNSAHYIYTVATKGGGIYLYDRSPYSNGTNGTDGNMPYSYPALPSAVYASAASGAGTAVNKQYGGGGSGGTGGGAGIYLPSPSAPNSQWFLHKIGLGSGDSADHGAVRIDWRRYAF